MGPRAGLSVVLLMGAVVLLAAIAVGNGMGNRVLGQIAGHVPSFSTTPLPVATPSPDAANNLKSFSWKRRQVLSVATDPAFPDPRVTPEPTHPPTPQPTRKPTAKPSPRSTASPRPRPPHPSSSYTSPPMLYPMASPSPDGEPTSGDGPAGSGVPSAGP